MWQSTSRQYYYDKLVALSISASFCNSGRTYAAKPAPDSIFLSHSLLHSSLYFSLFFSRSSLCHLFTWAPNITLNMTLYSFELSYPIFHDHVGLI